MMDLEKELRDLHDASFQWALHCTGGSRTDAEDTLQAAYEALLDGSARFEERASLKSFLFGVIRNKARSLRRRRGLVRLFSLEAIQDSGVEPRGTSRLEQSEQVQAVRAALQECSPRQQEVLELVFYHDLTVEQAAEVLGLQIGTARTHYARGKDALRRKLREGERKWSAMSGN